MILLILQVKNRPEIIKAFDAFSKIFPPFYYCIPDIDDDILVNPIKTNGIIK